MTIDASRSLESIEGSYQLLYGIYNADAGLLGEMDCLDSKVLGRKRCALCDLTHGLHPKGRQNWRLAYLKNTADLLLVQGN
ncbi:MAG TPA: hypothetical protein EYP93_10505, partial [Gammaproteobacteria bacterium]|nr:hypothetical protein [Gammaproteobacteria bacterium]